MKGQISIEFLVYFSFILLVSSIFLINNISTSQRLSDLKMDTEANKLLERVAFEINSAVIAGDGYQRRFYLEERIGGFSDYSIKAGNYIVFLDWDGRAKSSTIITQSINGTIGKEWNWIRNVGGAIYVN